MDMMFGSGSPMWTAFPTMGLPYQPLGFGNRTIPGPTFGTPGTSPGLGSPLSSGLALNGPASWLVPDASGVITPSTLLTAVALRRGQPQGPTNDSEVEEFIYDALDLLPGAADVEVRCENGRVTLTGAVQHKRSKRDVGEIAWAIPGLQDVQNNVSITSRRRARVASREAEVPAAASGRKQA